MTIIKKKERASIKGGGGGGEHFCKGKVKPAEKKKLLSNQKNYETLQSWTYYPSIATRFLS